VAASRLTTGWPCAGDPTQAEFSPTLSGLEFPKNTIAPSNFPLPFRSRPDRWNGWVKIGSLCSLFDGGRCRCLPPLSLETVSE